MFPCTNCGLCCQNIASIKELKEFDLGNGVCKYFDKVNNNCKIYEIRPSICKIDYMFELEYYKYFGKKEFYKLNAKICNELQNKLNLDKKYQVIIGE